MLNILNKIFDNPKSIKSRFGRLLNKLNIKKIFVAIESFSSDSEIRYVGGCVRKILNNEKVDDIDLATNINPQEVKQVLKKMI